MLVKRVLGFGLVVFIFGGVFACTAMEQGEPAAATGQMEQTPVEAGEEEGGGAAAVIVEEPLGPGEVLHVSGEGSYISDPMVLEGRGEVELFWVQDCQIFYLQLYNANEALAEAPGGTVIFESAASPTENTETDGIDMRFAYLPGEYVVRVDAEGGAWEVWAKVTPLEAD